MPAARTNCLSCTAERAELNARELPASGLFDPRLTDADPQRHLMALPDRTAVLDAPDDRSVAIAAHFNLAAFQADVGEVGELADPLGLVQHVALFADGSEVVGQQHPQRGSVGVQLGLVEDSR